MAKAYHQLTGMQRYQIETLPVCQWPQNRIAQYLNVSKSTIIRELKRNCTADQLYDADAAKLQSCEWRTRASSFIVGI